MNDRQENNLSRFYAIRKLCENNRNAWENYLPFVRSFGEFLAIIPQLEQNRDIQMTRITGVGEDKKALRQELAGRAWFICSRVQSFATATQNDSLLRSVKMSCTSFTKGSDTSLIGRVNIVLQKAGENLANLEPYGVTQQLFDELETTNNDYSTALSSIEDAVSTRKTATSALKELFSAASSVLRQRLDLDAQYFKDSHAEFYNQYIEIRGLKKGGRKKKRNNNEELKKTG
jgi:predicted RNA-binding protein YlxR (DUF448 family)